MEYIEFCIADDKPYYILLDEVRLLEDFEEVLNLLLHIRNADIYVTGSNSRFLSKDVMNVTRDEDGITTMSIYDFLLKENSLELY